MSWKRRTFRGSDLARALTILELRAIARRRIPNIVFEYIEGGAEDEASLKRNRQALEALRFVPSTLVDTRERHQRTMLFGREAPSPLVVAPTGGNGMVHARGDLALARAAASRGVPFCLSTVSTVALEEVAAATPGARLWMQLYVMRERAAAERIVARAAAAGYEALVFTTDANVFGAREWDVRNYRRPGKPTFRNLLSALSHPAWLFRVLIQHGVPRFENFLSALPAGAGSALGGSTVIPKLFEPSLTWDDVKWLRTLWRGKLLVKGVLSVVDAERAVEAGCDGIILTNHGGRQLDYCVSGVDVLPQIASAVGRRTTIIVDGGFRRGSDVIKALALGAHSVMIARATLYGLMAAGERGARRALEILTSEIDRTLGQLGCRTIGELGPHLLGRARISERDLQGG